MMKSKLLSALILILTASAAANAAPAEADTLEYKVNFHWGFIDKVAAHGRITTRMMGDTLYATLDGHSIPWEGRQYTVSDTLHSVFSDNTESVLYINGRYSKPHINNGVVEKTDLYRNINGQGELSASPETMEAVTITAQMLGMFPIAKQLDFDRMSSGQVTDIPITMPGKAPKDRVRIEYIGEIITDQFGAPRSAYHITFTYSYRGKLSSYPVDCLIDSKTRILLKMSASLVIGHLEMLLED